MIGWFTEVTPTEEELTQWRARKGNEGRFWPSVARVRCDGCGRRLWGSGLGLGSHRRACKGS